MATKSDSKTPEQATPARTPTPRKRFRIEKIEERITPSPHLNPHTKLVGTGSGGGSVNSSASGSSGSIY
jgi:hypothetical protein